MKRRQIYLKSKSKIFKVPAHMISVTDVGSDPAAVSCQNSETVILQDLLPSQPARIGFRSAGNCIPTISRGAQSFLNSVSLSKLSLPRYGKMYVLSISSHQQLNGRRSLWEVYHNNHWISLGR